MKHFAGKLTFWLVLAMLWHTHSARAAHLDTDQLLRNIKALQSQESQINQEREARFLADKQQQQRLLAQAEAELAEQERASQQLKAQIDANEQTLTRLEEELSQRSGMLGELFGVARQAAADLKADLSQSVISAQYPGRGERLAALSDSKILPTIEQLIDLWYIMQQEMTESGKIVRYQSNILTATGEERPATIIRLGAFNAIADNQYLRYLPELGKSAELPRQPPGKFSQLAEDFSETTADTLAPVAIDPTRGVILGMLVQTPDIFERLDQGGIIGYIIMTIGILGLAFGVFKSVQLALTRKKMHKQLNDLNTTHPDNPLGRIIASVEEAKVDDLETLELVLDDAITREVPQLEKGISMIKLMASVAPLLGLLGTVTGMIATFQSISLFGTGDPKLMAGGISQALVTTMQGLIVAIPLLFVHSLLVSRSRTLIQIIDEQSAALLSRRAGK